MSRSPRRPAGCSRWQLLKRPGDGPFRSRLRIQPPPRTSSAHPIRSWSPTTAKFTEYPKYSSHTGKSFTEHATRNSFMKPITGTWMDFQHQNQWDGYYWNDQTRAFSCEQWQGKVDEIAGTGMDTIVIM